MVLGVAGSHSILFVFTFFRVQSVEKWLKLFLNNNFKREKDIFLYRIWATYFNFGMFIGVGCEKNMIEEAMIFPMILNKQS